MRKPVLTCTFLLGTAIALALVAAPASAADRYELRLESRTYVPSEVKLARAEDSHLVVQFYEIPTEAEREVLADAGITLLDYVPNYAWTAHVRGGAVQALEPGLVRAVFELRAEDKVRRSATGRDVVRAFVYDGVEGAEGVLERYGSIIDVDRTGYTLVLEGDILELAGEDIVKCVMGPRPEMIVNNDELRDNINADEVQTAPYDLHGYGLTAGIWDAGTAATNHDDYNSRLTLGDGSSTHYPATQCIGILGGDGTRSAAEGGSPYQWRGVATEVDLVSYDWPYDLTDMDAETGVAISSYDIVVSSNSWSWGLCPDYCYYFGTYDDYSNNYDRIVRGGEGKKLTVVFSAGNEGDCSDCSGDLPDFPYGTVPGPGSSAKNTICVGSNNADNDALSYYSSRGPVLDGRIKPDVVAPGCKSYEGITTTYLYNDYSGTSCGTSFSCPAVAGCVVLTQEDYIDKFGGEAWPSTVKALLIQGAEDQGNTGPDYEFGFGRVNIQNTIDIIRTDNGTADFIKEDALSPAETWEYDIEVTPGEDLRVTLVWDDYPGDWATGGTMLVNDLDLELEAPGGGIYYPWLLDPTSPGSNATTGGDHLNNVEQVEVASPASGTWTIRVTATVMPEPDQDFSLVTNFAGGAVDPPPAAPTGLDAVPGAGEGGIDVSWDANSEPDLDHYRLERADNPAFTGASSFVVAGTSYGDSGLTPGDTYYYRVFAVDVGANESGASNTDSAVATDLPPTAPTGLDAVPGAGEGDIDVSWSANSEPDLDHYRLERADNPAFTGASSFVVAGTSYGDSGLTPGDTYHYRVFAVDAGANESGASNVDSAVATDLPPAPPTGLIAVTGTAEGEIEISWSASPEPDFDRYRLERSTAPDFEPGSEPFEGAVASFTDTGLVPGGLYYYRVYAIDVNENVSDPSNVDSAIALDLAPAVPTGLLTTPGAGEGEIDVVWDANAEPDLSYYDLEWDTDPGFPAPTPVSVVTPSYGNAGLIPGETYWHRVRAVDETGNWSDWSAPHSAVATDLAPATPLGLWAASGADEGEIDVGWDANGEPDFDHYRLERHTDPGFGPGSDPFDWTLTFFPDSGLIPGETYYYRVIAVDANGNESDPSAPVSALATDLAPSAPTGIVATPGAGEGEIDVAWDPNSESDLDHYVLQRDTDAGFPAPLEISTTGTSWADTGLTPGETYHYRVVAVDANSNPSSPSAAASAVATDLPPAAPTGLIAVPGVYEGEIDLSWNPSPEPDFDHYRLERDVSADFTGPESIDDIFTVEYTDFDLAPGQTYFYRVYAVDVNLNEGPPSNVDSAEALDLAPAAPTGLTAVEGAGEGEVDVSWDANSEPDFDHYVVERDTSAQFGPATFSLSLTETSYLDSGLGPDTYFYRVVAVDANSHESVPSDTVSITLEQTGVEEELVAGLSYIRPNPFATETTIHYTVPDDGADVAIRLYDIRGRLVRTLADHRHPGGAYEITWDGRDGTDRALPSGIYFAEVTIGEWGEMRKITYVR